MSDIDQCPRVLYTAEATVTGGRRGHGVTSDGVAALIALVRHAAAARSVNVVG